MENLITAIKQYTEGLITLKEFDAKLGRVHGRIHAVDGKAAFVGYDYENQAWITISFSHWGRSW